ncbi:MAG: DUF4424 family protein [Thermodesulfobacteriota bacterium]
MKQACLRAVIAALFVLLAILTWPLETPANDSIAALGAGGIELLKSDNIRMLEEVLEISPRMVRVKYRFLNETDQDIHTPVAFPLPAYPPGRGDATGMHLTERIWKTFKVLEDGRPVVTHYECKAMLDGRDVTGELRWLGLSDDEIFFRVRSKGLGALEGKLGAVRRELGAWWHMSQIMSWSMTFPARKEIAVEHEYAPVTGHGWAGIDQAIWKNQSGADLSRLWNSFTGKEDERADEDCLDERTKRAVENRIRVAMNKGAESVMVFYTKVAYVLGTGRNWKGPIGDFILRLVKEKPDQFVSVCFPGQPKKISPTVYEFHEKDFVPQDTLAVYFYTVDAR